MTPYRRQPRSEIYAELHRRLAAYRRGEYILEQSARLELTAFCQRHGLNPCTYCPRIDECTALGSHVCANHYARAREVWF